MTTKKIILTICMVIIFNFIANAQRITNGIAEFLNDDLTSAMLSGMENVLKAGGSSGDFRDAASTLSNEECVPDFTQDLSSDIDISCYGEPTCETCFAESFAKLNFYRRQLARLRCIYNNTKTYKDAAVAFGDNASGIHAMSGIAWQKERAKIMTNYKNMQKTYDLRSTEFLTGLQATLQELNTCMYISGENNWYVKSGFIYFEFMQERYKRND
jgi:hypothetical protein